MIDSPAEEDKLMWDYCTPGAEALPKEVPIVIPTEISFFDDDNNSGGRGGQGGHGGQGHRHD